MGRIDITINSAKGFLKYCELCHCDDMIRKTKLHLNKLMIEHYQNELSDARHHLKWCSIYYPDIIDKAKNNVSRYEKLLNDELEIYIV